MFDSRLFERRPGLYRRWEIQQLLDDMHDFLVEYSGNAEDGTMLYAVYTKRYRDHVDFNDRESG